MTNGNFAERLRQHRLAQGISLEELSARTGGLATKQAISKYEHGKMRPTPRVLNAVAKALNVRAMDLLRQSEAEVRVLEFRKVPSLSAKEQQRVRSLICTTLESRIQLVQKLQSLADIKLPYMEYRAAKPADAEKAAEKLRELWDLGSNEIANVVNVLEDHHVHVIEIDADPKFDGLSAIAFDPDDKKRVLGAAALSRTEVRGERQRLTLGHELGHIVLKPSSPLTHKEEEAIAFRFGGAFLLPADTCVREVGGKRTSIELGELFLLRSRYGMSLQALVYRLKDLGIISQTYYQWWFRLFAKKGWRKEEPNEAPREQPTWLKQQVYRALAMGVLDEQEAERLLISEVPELEKPLDAVSRAAFLELPAKERRRKLELQAQGMSDHYEKSEWLGVEGEDVVDY